LGDCESASKRNERARIAFAFAWALSVVVLSFLPSPYKQHLHSSGPLHLCDHFLAFGLGAVLIGYAFRTTPSRIIVGLFTLLLACLLELGQHSVYRSSIEWSDMAADALGFACGGFLLWIFIGRWASA
jgi:hypothetical protein